MAKGFTILPNGLKLLIEMEAADVPDLPAGKLTSDELNPDRLPTKGIAYEKLAATLVAYLIDEATRAADVAILAAAEDRANEHYPVASASERRANEYYV